MNPIEFPEANASFAKDQDEYLTLPAFFDGERVISCWQLNWKERLTVLFTGRIFVHQLTFGAPLQPQAIQTENPFSEFHDYE